jgi:hypothetical protein
MRGSVVIRRRPAAVYRVIDEDELLFGDGAATWPGGAQPRWSPASDSAPWTSPRDSPKARAGRRAGGWSRVAVLVLLFAGAGAGTLVVAAGPQHAAAGSRAAAAVTAAPRTAGPPTGLRSVEPGATALRSAGPRATRPRADAPRSAAGASAVPRRRPLDHPVTLSRPRPARLGPASVRSAPRATVLAEPASGPRFGHRNPRRAARRARPPRSEPFVRAASRASSPHIGTRTRPLVSAGATATRPSTSVSVPSAPPSPQPPAAVSSPQLGESSAHAPPPTTPVSAPGTPPPRASGLTAPAAGAEPPSPAAEFGFER